MINEARGDENASQGARKRRQACMQWPPHSDGNLQERNGSAPLWAYVGGCGGQSGPLDAMQVKNRKESQASCRRRGKTREVTMKAIMLIETTEHVKANTMLRDEDAHLRRVGACSRWNAADSGRLGCKEISVECEDSRA